MFATRPSGVLAFVASAATSRLPARRRPDSAARPRLFGRDSLLSPSARILAPHAVRWHRPSSAFRRPPLQPAARTAAGGDGAPGAHPAAAAADPHVFDALARDAERGREVARSLRGGAAGPDRLLPEIRDVLTSQAGHLRRVQAMQREGDAAGLAAALRLSAAGRRVPRLRGGGAPVDGAEADVDAVAAGADRDVGADASLPALLQAAPDAELASYLPPPEVWEDAVGGLERAVDGLERVISSGADGRRLENGGDGTFAFDAGSSPGGGSDGPARGGGHGHGHGH